MSRCSDLHSSNMQQPTFRTFISDIFVKLKVLAQLKFNVLCLYFCTSLVLHCLACIERVCRGTENHYSCFRPGRRNAELGQGPLLVLMDDGDGEPRPDTVSPFLEGTFHQSFCQFGTWTSASILPSSLVFRTEILRNDALRYLDSYNVLHISISSWTLCVLRSHYVAPVVGIVILHTSYSL